MRSIYDFIITPKKSRYNNTKKVGDKELILNTAIFNHQYVSREAIVKHVPIAVKTEIQPGDEIIVHHNVFRRWHNIRGEEKNSRSYINENTYAVREDQIFLYKHNNKWITSLNYCFIKPITSNNKFDIEKEIPNFKKNYEYAQKLAKGGFAQRKDMPVYIKKMKEFISTFNKQNHDNIKEVLNGSIK